MKQLNIIFNWDEIDTEKVRECIEDNLGVEIISIDEAEIRCSHCNEVLTSEEIESHSEINALMWCDLCGEGEE